MNYKQFLMAAIAAGATVYASAGTLGEQYVSVDAALLSVEEFEGWGSKLSLNLPVVSRESFGIDVLVGGGYTTMDVWGKDLDAYDASAGAVFFFPVTARLTPFVAVQAGHTWADDSDNEFSITGYAGVEVTILDNLSATAAVGVADTEGSGDNTNLVRVGVDYWVSQSFGLGVNAEFARESKIDGAAYGVTGRYRF